MRASWIAAVPGLFVVTAAQTKAPYFFESSAVLSSEAQVLCGGHYATTVVDQKLPYTVYECDFEAEAHHGGWSKEERCKAVSTVTTLSLDKSFSIANSSLTVVSTSTAGRSFLADPASVLEARMERKFGVNARSVPPLFGNGNTPVFPTVVTVTSTTTILSVPASCVPSPSHRPFPLFHDIPNTASIPAAEVTAMSIVAGMLTKDIAILMSTATSTPLPSDIIPIMVSVLTANASAVASNTTFNGNMSVTSAGMTSSSPAHPSTATSDGSSLEAGASVAVLAIIGMVYLLA